MDKPQFLSRFVDYGMTEEEAEKAFNLMLWYGVLGIKQHDGSERFIYDYEYNIKRLSAETKIAGRPVKYVTNAALHVALST